jgi:hypothetical protein
MLLLLLLCYVVGHRWVGFVKAWHGLVELSSRGWYHATTHPRIGCCVVKDLEWYPLGYGGGFHDTVRWEGWRRLDLEGLLRGRGRVDRRGGDGWGGVAVVWLVFRNGTSWFGYGFVGKLNGRFTGCVACLLGNCVGALRVEWKRTVGGKGTLPYHLTANLAGKAFGVPMLVHSVQTLFHDWFVALRT